MFFIAFFGIEDKEKNIGTCSNIVCPSCERWSRYEIYKTYRCFHIFFIQVWKWNVKYLVKSTCCGSMFELDPVIGREFEKNPGTEIKNEHLKQLSYYSPYRYCANCRVNVPASFNYCPYCGGKLQ